MPFRKNLGILSFILIGYLLMAAWYIGKGKSVKALNDLLHFISTAVAGYYFLFDFKTFKDYHAHR
ncbi:hypothetical protein [Serratia symbiotica]|uniref:hypothetical protein n=1 Tax=Serratia symbiotica TaxID=138074 RepID=UPI001AE7CFD7|nr:hypothetical protein [Serratia symbiotica]QTP14008.1 hypothetical protein GPZ83_0011485 [Serratia symbiotica]